MTEEIICYCKNVSRKMIEQAIENGSDNLEKIKVVTKAATGTKCKEKNPKGICCSSEIIKILENDASKKKVLFVCIHNSARSQMAEAFLNKLGGDKFIAESAGLEPGKLNPYVVSAMQQIGIDISRNITKSIFSVQNKKYDYIIAVCDKEAADKCPNLLNRAKKLHWEFEDPSSFIGNDEEKLIFACQIRDEIKAMIQSKLIENDIF